MFAGWDKEGKLSSLLFINQQMELKVYYRLHEVHNRCDSEDFDMLGFSNFKNDKRIRIHKNYMILERILIFEF